MLVQRQECKVERNVGDARIWFENSKQAKKSGDYEKRLDPQPNRQTTNVTCQMQPENAKEECSERIKDLYKEIPPQTDVRCEVRYEELKAIGRRYELPGARYDIGQS